MAEVWRNDACEVPMGAKTRYLSEPVRAASRPWSRRLSVLRRSAALCACLAALAGCSSLPIGDPANPEVGLSSVERSIQLVVPLCPSENVKLVELRESIEGSPPLAWSGKPKEPGRSTFNLDASDFSDIDGSYDIDKSYTIEVVTNQVVYISDWTRALQRVPEGSVSYQGTIERMDEVRPTCK
jgi:hypothetical protein